MALKLEIHWGQIYIFNTPEPSNLWTWCYLATDLCLFNFLAAKCRNVDNIVLVQILLNSSVSISWLWKSPLSFLWWHFKHRLPVICSQCEPPLVSAFCRECQDLAKLGSPNILVVFVVSSSFLLLYHGGDVSTHIGGLLWRLNNVIHLKDLSWLLAHIP